jgi:hypothetical protein
MKKSIFALAAGCLCGVILSGHVLAQGPNSQASPSASEATLVSEPTLASFDIAFDPTTATALDKSTVNFKAIKDFKDRFGNVTNEKWYAQKDGFLSYFTDEGFATRAYYNKKGQWQYSLKFYPESKLPRDIRAIVKSTYYDFSITIVEQVEIPEHLVYLVHLEDNTSLKIVRVTTEGDMDVIQDLRKN